MLNKDIEEIKATTIYTQQKKEEGDMTHLVKKEAAFAISTDALLCADVKMEERRAPPCEVPMMIGA